MRWMLHLMDLRGVAMGVKSWRVVKIPYTRLEEEETLIENDSIFCESQIFGGQTTLVSGLLKLGISLGFDKKYFGIIQGFQR